MRTAVISCSLLLALACSSKSRQVESETPATSAVEATDSETGNQEAAGSEEESTPETAAESDTVSAEAESKPPEADAAPAAPKRKRYRRSGSKVRKGDRAIELKKVVNNAGKRVTLESQQAPVLVLTFGASWCAPCKKELPALEKLAKGYPSEKVTFVAVNIDSSIAKGKAFTKKAGLKRVLALYDPKSSNVQSYDPPTMPTTFIVNQGIVKHMHAGFRNGDAGKLKKAIDRELN
jgi:thiol-disulfide isomerase/thioredoxin